MSSPSESSSSSSSSSSMVPWLRNACSSFASLRARQVTGMHLLRIDGYSAANRMVQQGESIESRTFSAGGHKWRLCIFPNGVNRHEPGPAVELELMKRDSDDYVVAAYGLSGLGRDGEPASSYAVGPQRFNRGSKYKHRVGIVVKPEVMRRLVEDGGDTLAVRCDLTVTKFDKESRFKYYLRKLID